tara:strand:+ start:41 stop:292 length:252 start_codon:yes stop_codon:yes gene_type:complete
LYRDQDKKDITESATLVVTPKQYKIMKIAIIGTGNLGKSIAKGLITNNAITSLYLTKRNLEDIQEFDGYKNVHLTTDNTEAVR